MLLSLTRQASWEGMWGLAGRSTAAGRVCWGTLTGVSHAVSKRGSDCMHSRKNRTRRTRRARLVSLHHHF